METVVNSKFKIDLNDLVDWLKRNDGSMAIFTGYPVRRLREDYIDLLWDELETYDDVAKEHNVIYHNGKPMVWAERDEPEKFACFAADTPLRFYIGRQISPEGFEVIQNTTVLNAQSEIFDL